ncbi:hypothetical protein GCM10009840_16510 [Pseudolysinimonas kribbensis]|uniref:Periplasmic heavy metal sensor n=1 Tax=Pseudolysinimonas kribbensis TaxID=433641 RepID=A0ABQ6K065_9MICO|nr:hypothetical protein [Pseudolysinimonas kribbensis]GMA93986.1 hypothetical protein GCM10025881_08100 [Pseudolysinimonas kribbensis]
MRKALVLAAASISTAAALVLGGAAAANAATPPPAPTPTSSGSCSFAQHLVHDWLTLPKALRTDLKAAKAADSKAERLKDLKAIRSRALAGDYGKAVESRAEHLRGLRPLPDALKADLTTLRGESTRAQKVQEAGEIASKALAGDYGDAIQSLAKHVQSSPRWQSCTPKGS